MSIECDERPELMDLPPEGRSRLARLLHRAIRLKCPQCGNGGIFRNPLSIAECCPTCGYTFAREDGYFLGAYALNLVVAEVLGVGAILVFLLRSDYSTLTLQITLVVAALLLPVVFFPFSRTLWMTVDLMVASKSDS